LGNRFLVAALAGSILIFAGPVLTMPLLLISYELHALVSTALFLLSALLAPWFFVAGITLVVPDGRIWRPLWLVLSAPLVLYVTYWVIAVGFSCFVRQDCI
jgi:hypothetical protein